jgi:hypothetical protein
MRQFTIGYMCSMVGIRPFTSPNLLKLGQFLNSIADPVSIAHKAFVKLLLSNLIVKPDDRLTASAFNARRRRQTGDAMLRGGLWLDVRALLFRSFGRRPPDRLLCGCFLFQCGFSFARW